MQVLPRWRNVLILKNSIIQSTTTTVSSSTHLASFHSTPTSFEKWKSKLNSDVRRGQQPSKNYIRYETRQKRSDAKRALKDILFNSGSSKITFQDYFPKMDGITSWNTQHEDHSDSSGKRSRSKSSTHRASKAQHKRMKRGISSRPIITLQQIQDLLLKKKKKKRLEKKFSNKNLGSFQSLSKSRQESFSDDFDEHHETIFQATFGNRWCTWSFKSWEQSSFQTSTNGFEWSEHSNWTNNRNKEWQNASDIESDDECVIGSSSDRAILGLPSRGPLKIEDVKNAFRLSALKWHPDKHQRPSQAMAEEKFKLCVNAYKSLCRALSSA